MKNYIYTLLSATLIAAPMLAMEKHPADCELVKNTSKKARSEVAHVQPNANLSLFENLPLDVKKIILGYLTTAEGVTPENQLANACKNIRTMMLLSKTMLPLASHEVINRELVEELAKRFKNNKETPKLGTLSFPLLKLYFLQQPLELVRIEAMTNLHTPGIVPAFIEHTKKTDEDKDDQNSLEQSFEKALYNGNIPGIKLFLQNTSIKQTKKWKNGDFFGLACKKAPFSIVKLVIENGCKIKKANVAFCDAALHRKIETVKFLHSWLKNKKELASLELYEYITGPYAYIWGPLLLNVVEKSDHTMAAFLIEIGANPNEESSSENHFIDKHGHESLTSFTPLMIAAKEGLLETVKVLLNAKAEINTTSKLIKSDYFKASILGMTALMFAVQNGHTQMVEYLLNVPGIDINCKNSEGKTALDLAIQSNKPNKNDIKNMLISHSWCKTIINRLTIPRNIVLPLWDRK